MVDHDELARRLQMAAAAAPSGHWVRGVGYDDTATGLLDAEVLDDLLGEHRSGPVRVQHRSGHQWVLEWAGVELVEGTEGLRSNRPAVGVYLELDEELRCCWRADERPAIDTVGVALAAFGITGATDATATNGPDEVAFFERAQAEGAAERRHLLGRDYRCCGSPPSTGARKIVLADMPCPPSTTWWPTLPAPEIEGWPSIA